ncbi:unnamed protein product, partial [Closterium sp. Naga37s-1]
VWPLEINSPLSWKAIEPMARELKTVSKGGEGDEEWGFSESTRRYHRPRAQERVQACRESHRPPLMNAPLSLTSSPLCVSAAPAPPLISSLAEKAIDLMNAPLSLASSPLSLCLSCSSPSTPPPSPFPP